MKKLALLLFTIYPFFGLAQLGVSSIEPETFPALNSIATADIGDNIINTKLFEYKREVFCNDPVVYIKDGKSKAIKIKPNFVFKESYYSNGKDLDKFCALYECIGVEQKTSQITEVIIITKFILKTNTYPVANDKSIFLKERVIDKINMPLNFTQQFIYNGKSGSVIKFTYREFFNDIARPAFTQEVQYDLNESKVIGFKGAKFEIISATNSGIEYKTIAPFKLN